MAYGYGPGPVASTTGQNTGLLGQGGNNQLWSNGAPNPNTYYGAAQPYQYGLQTSFNLAPDQATYDAGDIASSTDPDVMAAQNLANEEQAGRLGTNPGIDYTANNAALAMYEGRIAEKNSLGQSIANNGTNRMGAIQSDQATANTALGQGINNTDSNYNSRGLLFSGVRQAGEQQVRGQVGSSLASSIAGTQQDYAQTLAAQQNAYANVDLAGASQALTMANNAVNTASQNNIARLQAMQQLGAGVGTAAGTVAGSANAPSGNPASYINPAAGWDPSGSSGVNTPYSGTSGQFGGYLSDPSYSGALGDSYFGSASSPATNPYGSQ